jgi:hypothetical protein
MEFGRANGRSETPPDRIVDESVSPKHKKAKTPPDRIVDESVSPKHKKAKCNDNPYKILVYFMSLHHSLFILLDFRVSHLHLGALHL